MSSGNPNHPVTLGQALSGGRYRIKKRLGAGGMASVYLADDKNLGVAVAIKFPDPNLLQNPDFRNRFLQETRSLVHLRHPNILKIIDVGQDGGSPYAVMDYLSGGSVNDQRFREQQGNFIPVVPAFFDKWLNRIAEALDFIHRKGYVHRDIKPDNILFDEDGNAFLSDFGIAKAYEETKNAGQENLTRTGMLIGTPEYMAPEISLGQKYDGRSDQYSLAVMIYELLVGSRPFVGATPAAIVMQQSTRSFHQLDDLRLRWSDMVASVLMRALSNKPEDRFVTCAEFESSLAKAFAETTHRRIDERVVSKCPNCAAPITLQPEWVGKIARCNKCNERMQIQPTGMLFSESAAVSNSAPIPAPTPPPVPAPTSRRATAKVIKQHAAGPSCPNCSAVLHISPDLRGKLIKCSMCQTLLRASEDGSKCFAASGATNNTTVNENQASSLTDTLSQHPPCRHPTDSGTPGNSAKHRSWRLPSILIATGVTVALLLAVLPRGPADDDDSNQPIASVSTTSPQSSSTASQQSPSPFSHASTSTQPEEETPESTANVSPTPSQPTSTLSPAVADEQEKTTHRQESIEDQLKRLTVERNASLTNTDVQGVLKAVEGTAALEGGDVLEMKIDVVIQINETAKSPADFLVVAENLLRLLEQAISEKRKDVAERHIDAMLVAARKSGDANLVRRATLCVLNVQQMESP